MKEDELSVLIPSDLGFILRQWDGESDSTFYRELDIGGSVIGETVHLVSRFRLARIYAHDITKRKKAEKALLAVNEELEQRVAERTAELEASAARIQEELEKRMKVEESLERQASLLVSVLDSVGDGVVVADRNGKLLFLNPEGQRIVRQGIIDAGPDEWAERYGIFMPDKTTSCPTDRIPLVRAIAGESFDDVEHFISYDPKLDGTWISCSGRPLRSSDGVIQGGVVAFRDITARKQAEKSLRISMELTEKIFSNIHFCVVYLDAGFNFLRVNQAYSDASGQPPEYFIGKNHFDVYPDEENEAIFRNVVATGEPFHVHGKPFEYPEHPEWGLTYWDWSLLPLKGPDGKVDGLIFVLVDVTERQRATRALQSSEEQFRTLVGNSLVGIMIVRNGRVVYMNPEQKKLFGHPPDSFELRSFRDVHPEDMGKFEELCDAVTSDGGDSRDMEFRFYPFGRSAEGIDMRWVHCRGTPIRSQGERMFLLNMVDITRLKEMEHQFLVREKMASLGHVAAGIAHEIRNPLSGINIHLTALEKTIEDDGGLGAESREQAGRIVEQIKSASERIESVIRKVMDFSRSRAPRPGSVNINMAIEEAIDFSTTFLRKRGITLDRSRLSVVPKCPADSSLITQVVMNLITNAAQALEGAPGRKVIEVSSGVLDERIFICVSDSGPGVPPAIREKIFDPFYTTRRDGYGIGLSFSRRVIAEHDGILTVGAGRLGGAEFRIELPLKGEGDPATANMGDGTATRR
jgi:PAS domain S-box-containing protein